MNESLLFNFAQEALTTTLYLAAPILLTSLVIGILVSLFQAATQINEATLTFIPKIVGVSLVLIVLGSWMGQKMLAFTTQVFSSLATMAH